MIRPRDLLRLAGLAAAALALCGCITVLPKTKPAQLYRFDAAAPAAGEAQNAPPAQPSARFTVGRLSLSFARETGGDRLLSVRGQAVAYIAGARWVAPAAVLFDEAVAHAFGTSTGPARLAARGEGGAIDYVLRLDVRNFEAVYERGPRAAPVVVVRLRAVLIRNRDQGLVDDQVFEARIKAKANRVSAIVAAFDAAVSDVLGQLVAWTDAKGKPA